MMWNDRVIFQVGGVFTGEEAFEYADTKLAKEYKFKSSSTWRMVKKSQSVTKLMYFLRIYGIICEAFETTEY